VAAGKVTHVAVAEGVGMDYTPVEDALDLRQSSNERLTEV
jgi:hypothetical protein